MGAGYRIETMPGYLPSLWQSAPEEMADAVKALAGEKYQDGLQYSDSDGKWTPGEEGYYYYSEPVAPGESSSVLDIKIDSKDTEDSFNVVVVQESTKVLYNEKNEPYADWTQIADTSETAGE